MANFLKNDYFVAGVLAIFSFLIYANTLGHGFVFDDDLVCRLNPNVQQGISAISEIFTSSWYEAFSGEKDRYYRPMMVASFALEKEWFGFNPFVFHLNNVILFSFCIFLLYKLLRALIPKLPIPIVIVTCLLFIAHPIHTEVVANIKGRDELFGFLGLMGMLLTSITYINTNRKSFLFLSLFCFWFALLSKESSLAFLGLIPLTLYFFTNSNYKDILKGTIPYVVLSFLYLLLRFQIVNTSPPPFDIIDNSLLAAESYMGRLATALYMIGLYIKLLIVPYPLSYDYSFNHIPIQSFTQLRVVLSIIVIAFLLIYSIIKFKSKDLLSFSILWMICTFIITSNLFFLIGTTFAERLMFVPSLGFCLGLSVLVDRILKRFKNKGNARFYAIATPVIIIYSMLTITRNQDWKSNEVLFSKDVKNAPQNSRVQSHYAKSLYDKSLKTNASVEAQSLLKSSIEKYHRSIEIYSGNVEVYQNLGLAYTKVGNLNKALDIYTKGIQVNDAYSPLYINRAEVYYNSAKYESAIEDLIKASQLTPNHQSIAMIFGLTYTKLKQYEKALPYLLESYDKNPSDRNTLVCLVEVYRNKNEIETAIFYDKKIGVLNNK